MNLYEPPEFKTWWESLPIPKGGETENKMRQIALIGYIEGQRQALQQTEDKE